MRCRRSHDGAYLNKPGGVETPFEDSDDAAVDEEDAMHEGDEDRDMSWMCECYLDAEVEQEPNRAHATPSSPSSPPPTPASIPWCPSPCHHSRPHSKWPIHPLPGTISIMVFLASASEFARG